jgi:hypothetical protein
VQRRVGDVLDLQVVQVASHQVRLELQRSEAKSGVGAEVAPLEVRPSLCCVHRRDVEQQVHSALDLGEPAVDVQSRRQLPGYRCHVTHMPTNM